VDIKPLLQNLKELKLMAETFFSSALDACGEQDTVSFLRDIPTDVNGYWDKLPKDVQATSQKTQEYVLQVISAIIPVLQSSPILDKSDERDIGECTKRMRSALKLRDFSSWDIEVLHDEGMVLGVKPPGQSEDRSAHPSDASKSFFQCHEKLDGIVQLLKITPSNIPNGLLQKNPNLPQSYRPNTAFIMMPIDPQNPELDDIYDVYKECFSKFGINAIRANDIEHEDIITKKIIEEIKTSEFLVGDLTNERPSVYYEIGYAHSLGRRVIMYRKKNTSIHFDLAAYNCPEYKNMKELKKILLKRLEDTTNRKPENG
jgi:hypothetical protein